MSYYAYASPLGTLILSAENDALTRISLSPATTPSTILPPAGILAEAATQLDEYFAGIRFSFSLPLAPTGTAFQQSVWNALKTIPYGKTVSYKDIGITLQNPNAVRAIGQANTHNPFPIIIPCHRVIQHDGGLGGYAYGLDAKTWLLEHEKKRSVA